MQIPHFLFGMIEKISLPIFLVYAGFIDPSISQNWKGPYITSSITALTATTILVSNKVPLNRTFIGIHIYLISGSVGLLTNQVWLNQLYGQMRASGMLAWIILVGVVSLPLSKVGFIGVSSPNRKEVVTLSLYLLLVSILCFLFSLYFRGNRMYSEYVPFIVLFVVQGFLRNKITHAKYREIRNIDYSV